VADFRNTVVGKPFRRRLRGRAAGPVIANDVGAAARCIQHETIAADAGGLGLDDALYGAGRDRSVHGIAAAAQHVERRRRGQGMGGRRHSTSRADGGPTGKFKVSH
jgi:hypothetical protein